MGRKIYFSIIFLLSIISIYLGFNSTIIPNIILYFAIIFYVECSAFLHADDNSSLREISKGERKKDNTICLIAYWKSK